MTLFALTPNAAFNARSAPADKAEGAPSKNESLLKAAKEFEALFIAEMLTYAGFDKALSSRGGFGAEAFSRMLVESYANGISEDGGFGLAEQIYRQLEGYDREK